MQISLRNGGRIFSSNASAMLFLVATGICIALAGNLSAVLLIPFLRNRRGVVLRTIQLAACPMLLLLSLLRIVDLGVFRTAFGQQLQITRHVLYLPALLVFALAAGLSVYLLAARLTARIWPCPAVLILLLFAVFMDETLVNVSGILHPQFQRTTISYPPLTGLELAAVLLPAVTGMIVPISRASRQRPDDNPAQLDILNNKTGSGN